MKSLVLLLVILSMSALTSCGKARAAGGATAHMIDAPLAGYTCFAITDGNGNAVGGNCVKD